MSSRPPSAWTALADASDPQCHGNKAAALSRVVTADVGVLPGWVLDVDQVSSIIDASSAHQFALQLLEIDATCDWILRSSSPLEDRAGFTAAGLLHSAPADPSPESIARALIDVAASARDPRVLALLGRSTIPVAILAQRHLCFDRWSTVHLFETGAGAEAWIEGWSVSADRGTVGHRCLARADDTQWRELLEIARRAASVDSVAPSLLEIGETGSGVHVLQVRPAPSAPPSAPTSATDDSTLTSFTGLGPHLHPGDEDETWIWDRAHSPHPLCPLIAGCFGRWLQADPTRFSSRLIEGRWHDRDRATSPIVRAEVETRLQEWRDAIKAVRAQLASIDEAVNSLDGNAASWREFLGRWMDAQTTYFSTRSAALRVWAAGVESADIVTPRLHDSIGARRARRFAALVGALEKAQPDACRSGPAIAAWVEGNRDHEIAARVLEELDRCAHLSALPYDGRAVPWQDQPAPFYRALARHRGYEPVAEAGPSSPDRELARSVMVAAEDDDEALLEVYLRWYRATTRLAGSSHEIRRSAWLDLFPDDLEEWFANRNPEQLRASSRRGRALVLRWKAALVRVTDPATLLHGIAAAPGRAEGTVVRVSTLESIERLDQPTIAVVDAVLPADAVVVPFLAGLVCESGDLLGHASILAREHGVPCVVDVADARRRLARAERIAIDGDAGRVFVLDGPELVNEEH